MVFSFQRARKTCLKIPAFVFQHVWLLIFLHLVVVFFNQWMMVLQETRMREKSDDLIFLMFGVAFVGFVFQSMAKVLWTFLACAHFSAAGPLKRFLKNHFELGLIESLRAFFQAVLWGLLFIIPGLVKMIRYQLVLFIVACDPEYQKGHVDALKKSATLTRSLFWGLTVLILFFAALSFALTPNMSFSKDPVGVFIYEFLGFFLICFQTLYFYFLYEDLTAREEI